MNNNGNRWQTIWERRDGLSEEALSKDEYSLFCELKRIDGFDVSVDDESGYRGFYNEFLNIYRKMQESIGPFSSVYEVGCGCGVNLYLFSNRIRNFEGGGIDFSGNLISSAKKLLKLKDLVCGEAIDIDTDRKYEVVMSESVFQYFPSYDYAREVMAKMLTKAEKLVYIGEISNLDYEEEQLAARRRQIPDYDEQYKGLERRFYSRQWFKNLAEEYGCKIEYTTVNNDQYVNGKYLFNVYLIKQ